MSRKRTITNLKAIANEEGKPIWFAYPRWIDGEAAVVYHTYETGKGQLYVYRLEDGSTRRVSTNAASRLPVSAWRSCSVLKKGGDAAFTQADCTLFADCIPGFKIAGV